MRTCYVFRALDGHFLQAPDDVLAQSGGTAKDQTKDPEEKHGRLWNLAHALGLVTTKAESVEIARRNATQFIKTLHINVVDEHGNKVDPATLSVQQLEDIEEQYMRGHCCMPGSDSGMLGAGGTRVTSHTLWENEGGRIDVENPNPGQRPGQIHYQDASGGKYIYDLSTKSFRGAPNAVSRLLEREDVQKAIQTGLRYLGVSP